MSLHLELTRKEKACTVFSLEVKSGGQRDSVEIEWQNNLVKSTYHDSL